MQYTPNRQTQKEIAQILTLCYQINCYTDFAAFFQLQGHANQINVRICKGKEEPEYNKKIGSVMVYLDWDNANGQLAGIITKLTQFLKEHKRTKGGEKS